MTALFVLGLIAPLQTVPPIPADSLEQIRRAARRAETNFERLARRLAPIKLAGSDGGRCDEIVGRFCLIYDSGRLPDPSPEPARVTDARRDAIEALRQAFTWLPDDFETAGPLVRYLVEDGRAQEAIPAARMFSLASGDVVWGPLLLGFALHAAGNDTAATREFAIGLERIGAREAGLMRDVKWLLGSADRGRYDDLAEPERQLFAERLWTMADPLYLTPGNERRNEHNARHVWSRILAKTPVVTDMVRWGSDLEQLTVRYGIPHSRTRSPAWGAREGSMTEHYDPDQLAYVPENLLTRGYPPTPLPDAPWELAETRSRSGYAPSTVSRLRSMPHQVSRFPTAEGAVVRVDGTFGPDSSGPGDLPDPDRTPVGVLAGLFVLHDGLELVAERQGRLERTTDSLGFAFEAAVQPGEYVYSLEAIEDSTRRAARARYGITIDPPSGLALSDPVIIQPIGAEAWPATRHDPGFRPTASLTFAPFDTVGIYAEVAGLAAGSAYDVQISIEKASRSSLPSRVASWLGDRLGLSSPSGPPRLRWTARAGEAGAATVAVNLALDGTNPGNHVIVLRVTDPTTGATAETRRVIRTID